METNYKDIAELIQRANALKMDLMKSGLIETFHLMNHVTQKIGWEAASILEGKHPLTQLKSKKKKDRS